MKKFLLILAMASTRFVFAQATEAALLNVTSAAEAKAKDTTNIGWKKAGTISLLFNQSAFNNEWQGGGTSNVAGNFGLNYNFNYKTKEVVWDNKVIAAYGLTKLKGESTSKTDDRFEFTSLYGKKASGDWFYSGFLNFKTQFDSGFETTTDADTDIDTEVKISHFFSPAYLQIGPGMLWKKSDNLKVNFAPATSKLIYVDSKFTTSGSSFGVLEGDTTRFEFGAAINAYYKLNLIENVAMENILNLYSNYLEDPQNVDIDYQMSLVMKINKYMSANISVQAIYDDNSIKAVQISEVFGLGVNYGF
jgi:hypothetical protein